MAQRCGGQIEDAAGLVGELRIALLAGLKPRDVARHDRLQRLGRSVTCFRRQPHLAHVRDIEQAAGVPRVRMLDQDAGGVLHRHLVAGERHDARTKFTVQFIQWRAL